MSDNWASFSPKPQTQAKHNVQISGGSGGQAFGCGSSGGSGGQANTAVSDPYPLLFRKWAEKLSKMKNETEKTLFLKNLELNSTDSEFRDFIKEIMKLLLFDKAIT